MKVKLLLVYEDDTGSVKANGGLRLAVYVQDVLGEWCLIDEAVGATKPELERWYDDQWFEVIEKHTRQETMQ